MGFKSIQTKCLVLVLSCVIGCAMLIGGVCVRNATRMSLREAVKSMNLTCENYQYKYDACLVGVQTAVETTATYASDHLESLERLATDLEYRGGYTQKLMDVLVLEATGTENVLSYYVSLSFEVPVNNGTTIWLEPFYDETSETEMVSCVAPFYKDGESVGLIGMDVNFSALVKDLGELRIYDSGYAFLCSHEGKVYYHPLYDAGTFIQKDASGFVAELSNESSGDTLCSGVMKGEDVVYAFRTLANGMRLVLCVPKSEITQNASDLARTVAALALGSALVSAAFTIMVCRGITKPLNQLTVAVAAMSKGDFSVPIELHSTDELGELAHALRHASIELRANAAHMRSLAFKDALTGVRNKTAYEMEIAALEQDIDRGEARFGIAVFDVSDLKMTNDLYGHEQGDKVLRIGCMRICRAFSHSPVFRVGGDEFVAIISGDEIDLIDKRIADFVRRGEEENAEVTQAQDVVKVAMGVAFFDPATDTCVQDVFNRADVKMYRDKQALKATASQSAEGDDAC